ncbi:MAG: septum formation initiator family protein [Candidatus Bipolaricaulia bacterium]
MRGARGDRLIVRFRPTRRTVLVTAAVALACLLAVLFVGRQLEVGRREGELGDLALAQAAALIEQDALRTRLEQRDDMEAVEALAREKLGLVMPGEEKAIFVEE